MQSRYYGAVMNHENRLHREKVENVFRLRNKKRNQEEHKKMKRLDEELRERKDMRVIQEAVRFRMVQAEEAEVLSKFMTNFHKRKRREMEDADAKEMEIDSGERKSKTSNKRRIARHLNEVYRNIFNNDKGYDRVKFNEFQETFRFTLKGIDDRIRGGCEKRIWDGEIKEALEKIKN